MKQIKKGKEPKELTEWKGLANDNWQPSYNDLRNPEKSIVKAALMEEQGYLCCYCEQELIATESHIEHSSHRIVIRKKPLIFLIYFVHVKIKLGKENHVIAVI
jgi:hypothetical protein